MAVEMVDVEQILQNPDNSNMGDVDAIEESIEISGMYKPLLVQRSTGYILVGNHTYLAAYRQGARQVPVIYLDVTDKAATRIMLADNATNRRGFDDEPQLAHLLSELRDSDIGLRGTGYEERDLEKLLNGLDEPLDFDADPVVDDRLNIVTEKTGRFSVTPIVAADGGVYELAVERDGMGGITKMDYQGVRKALGLNPASKSEITAFGVDAW